MKRLTLTTFVMAMAFGSIAGCGQGAPTEAAAPKSSAIPSCGQMNVESRSKTIRAEKRANPLAPDGKPAANSGDFAYASRPLDIAGPGLYVFEFGPVGDDFDFPTSPSALTYDFPPGFTGTAQLSAATRPQVVRLLDDRYLRASFNLGGDVPPCRAFIAIAY